MYMTQGGLRGLILRKKIDSTDFQWLASLLDPVYNANEGSHDVPISLQISTTVTILPIFLLQEVFYNAIYFYQEYHHKTSK